MIVYEEDKKGLIIPNGLGYTHKDTDTLLMPIVELTMAEYEALEESGNVKNNVIYLVIDL